MKTLTVVVALAASFAGCRGAEPPDSGAAPPASPAGGAFTVPAAQLARLHIAPVRRVAWATTLHTTGTVDWDNDHTSQAITQVGGPISRIVVDTGSIVRQGDPLLYVASPDVTAAISTYRKAANRLDLAKRTLERNRDLLAHKVIAQRDLESVEADYNDAGTDLETALQTLKILGVNQADLDAAARQNVAIRPELAMLSPMAGTVVQKLVLPGQVIQAGTTIAFVISNTSTVWVQGHIYEKDLPALHVGDRVDLSNASFPEAFHGVVTYIGDMLDPDTRTTPVRIVTRNPHGLLKKDLFVDIVLHDPATRDVLVVPSTAVLHDDQNFPFVYVEVSQGSFAQRLVKTGGQQGDDIEITDGLKAGERVVSEGSVFLQFALSFTG
jgi:cobalt-zinc-cadmium efflux system membrane fusion protein